ncbi:MAG: hypothetical protein KBE04_03295 [Phycisphaerae bacterium]|nr:hypothetical protein [Phycisphaerae bacterium]
MNNDPQPASPHPCPHCGATDIARDIRVKQHVETGCVGLDYKALGPLRGTEPLLADLCRGCGTICRFHVRNAQRVW